MAPLLNTLAISLSDKSAIFSGKIRFWPVGFTLTSYEMLLGEQGFFRAFGVSLVRVILGGGINFVLTVLMAYPLSKRRERFRARNAYMWIIAFTMIFNGGMIPTYMTVRALGILDSIWALVLPSAVQSYNIILLMNYFRSLPKEIEEAAMIDGAGPWRSLVSVFLPVSLPCLATITLFSIVGHWNTFFDGLIYMNRPENYPLQTYIQQMVISMNSINLNDPNQLSILLQTSQQTLNAAKIFVSMLPILLIYPLLQRYFVTGITLGSVKG